VTKLAASPSRYKEDGSWIVKNRIYSLAFLTVLSASYCSVILAAQEPQSLLGVIIGPQAKTTVSPEFARWYGRVGVANVVYRSSASVSAVGSAIPGASASVSNNETVIVDGGYYVTPNIAASLMIGFPPRPTLTGEGSVAAYKGLGSVRYGPAVASAHYHLLHTGAFQPYVGGGAVYAIILKNYDMAIHDIKVHNHWGSAIQCGADFRVTNKLTLFADSKQIFLTVNAKGMLGGVVPATARLTLNPTVISAGIKMTFGAPSARR
jgi:outer membrane protein